MKSSSTSRATLRVITSRYSIACLGVGLYLAGGATIGRSDVPVSPNARDGCTAPLLVERSRVSELSVLQGNFWMLPSRPLLIPFDLSTDRELRLSRLVSMVNACAPDLIVLQEVYEQAIVEALARALPAYTVVRSGITELAGTVNASGLVTLIRGEGARIAFHLFPPLPSSARIVEQIAGKGYLVADATVNGVPVRVVNIHLFAARDSAERLLAIAQLDDVVRYAAAEMAMGREVVIAGDFNLTAAELRRALPDGWRISAHGSTYDPVRNTYATQGANDTPDAHANKLNGRGVRAIDFLILPERSGMHATSETLTHVELSDHYFVQHRLQHAQPVVSRLRNNAP